MQDLVAPFVGREYHNAVMQGKLIETFGDRMRIARDRRHLTQTQVAEQCGLKGHGPVQHWELGNNFPSLDALVIVAGLYDVSIDWLVWGGEMSESIDGRIRKIPAVLRAGLADRLHKEIDKTAELAARLPKEMAGDHVKDSDKRLSGWSAANLKRALKKPKRHKE